MDPKNSSDPPYRGQRLNVCILILYVNDPPQFENLMYDHNLRRASDITGLCRLVREEKRIRRLKCFHLTYNGNVCFINGLLTGKWVVNKATRNVLTFLLLFGKYCENVL